jgi:SSS family solute:Na+ symporter
MENINVIDASIVIAYLIGCLLLGFKKFGKVTTLREYTMGSKPFTTPILIATTFATAIGTSKVIGNVGKSYQLGMIFAVTMFATPVGWFIGSRLLAHNITFFHQKNFMSLGSIMEYWYGKLARDITSISAIVLTLGVMATGSMAIGKLSNYFFGIPELAGMLGALSVVTIYSTFGGLGSVAITDVFQFFIFFIAIPIACFIGYHDIGGYKGIVEGLPVSHLKIDFKDIGMLFSLIVFGLLPNADVPFIQRALIAKNKYQLNTVFTFTGLLMFPLFTFVALIGFITYIRNPDLQTDVILFHFMKHYLPVGAIGLMIAGLLAVIMSTQDSFLNTTSSLIARDICKQIWPNLNTKQELLIARVSCVLLSVLSISFIFIHKDIMELIWFICNFWEPLVVTPFLLALVGVRVNKKLFFIIPMVTLASQAIARQMVGTFDTRTFTVGVVVSVIITLIISGISKKQNI